MSLDYTLYFQRQLYSPEQLTAYSGRWRLPMELHPEFDSRNDSGFLPVKLETDRFSGDGRLQAYLTGFEIYIDVFHSEVDGSRPFSLLRRLFRKRKEKPTDFDISAKNCDTVYYLCCYPDDPLSVLSAFLFGAAFCRCCGGVFEDPQTGAQYLTPESLEAELEAIIRDVEAAALSGTVQLQIFDKWPT